MKAVRGRATRIALALGVAAVGLVYTQTFLSATSQATSSTGWSAAVLVDSAAQGSLSTVSTVAEQGGTPASISCTSTAFCAMVDTAGNVALFNGSSWSATEQITTQYLTAVSCASADFCVTADETGHTYRYNGSTWSSAGTLPISSDPSDNGDSKIALSCPTSTFCLATDYDGGASLFNGTSWSATQHVSLGVTSVSCVSATFCMAITGSGEADIYRGTTSSPSWTVDAPFGTASPGVSTANTLSSGWTLDTGVDTTFGLSSVSCVSTTFCVATDPLGDARTYNGSLWIVSSGGPGVGGEISCATTTFCMYAGRNGDVTLFNGASWSSPQSVVSAGYGAGISCTSASFCMMVESNGFAQQFSGFQPTVTGVSPSSGSVAGGAPVTITGTNFVSGASVKFGSTPATGVTVVSATSITATSPPGSGAVDVTVTTPAGTSAVSDPADEFTYCACGGSITSVTPSSGPVAGGTPVTITGTGFTGSTAVHFGNAEAASFTVNSATSISATSPAGTGTVDVTVTTPAGTTAVSAPADQFTYLQRPIITGVSPTSLPCAGPSTLTITGTNFTSPAVVAFNDMDATVVDVSAPNTITVVMPAVPGTTISITVTTNGGTSPPFVIERGCQSVTSLSPDQGPGAGGTAVTITGTDLGDATAVDFGGTPATAFTVNSDTTITAVSPPDGNVVNDTVDVVVTTTAGTTPTSTADQFTYLAEPDVISVAPNQGPADGGTSVTITGTSFTGATAVKFGGVTASFTVNSDTSITATSPPFAPPIAPTNVVNVTVTTPNGSSSTQCAQPASLIPGGPCPDQFTYLSPPLIGSVSPDVGPTIGGTSVTIAGTNFTSATAVDFGATAATSFTVNSATSITASSPAGPAGTTDVTVTGPGGTSTAVANDRFTYVSPTPPPPVLHGYWLVGGDGGIFTFGSAHFFGSTGDMHLQRPVVGMTPTADHGGYWMVGSDGGMFAFGDATFRGSIPGLGIAPAGSGAAKELAAPIMAMVASPAGNGYLLVASDGGVFAFGDALFHGSCPQIGGCNGSVVAVVPDTGELGYWVVTSTGRVYPFGNAAQIAAGEPGSAAGQVTAAAASSTGRGYFVVTTFGDVYAYGDARNYQDPPWLSVSHPEIVGIVPTSTGAGYWLVGANGGVYPRGDAPNDGSMIGRTLNAPIVTAAGF